MKTLLVTGASGFLGWNLCSLAQKEWKVVGTVYTHPVSIPDVTIRSQDLTDLPALKRLFTDFHPDAVIHAAAASSPDHCEKNNAATEAINVTVPAVLAGLCAEKKVPYVFTSTDLVFNGLAAPYDERSAPTPINCYGEQKVRAEKAVLQAYPAAAVCRMPLMFGDPGPAASSFFVTMESALRQGHELRLFEDEFRSPASAQSAAEGLLFMLAKGHGILHMGGRERVSRYQFGLLLMDAMDLTDARITRCRQKDLKMHAPRPPDLSLVSAKAYALGYKPLPLREELLRLVNRHHGSPQ